MPSSENKAAADAFSEKLNATPAAGREADRFRAADDRLQSLSPASLATLRALGSEGLPPEITAALECWCLLHDEKPPSVAACARLAADPDDLRLVGMSSLQYLPAEDLAEITNRMAGLDPEVARARSLAAAEAAAVMIEWLQAALALKTWAQEQRAAHAS